MPKAIPPELIEASIRALFPRASTTIRPIPFEALCHRVALGKAITARQDAEQKLQALPAVAPATHRDKGFFGLFARTDTPPTEPATLAKGSSQAGYAAALLAETMIKTTIEMKRISDGVYDLAYRTIISLEDQLTKAHQEALAEADGTVTAEVLEHVARTRTLESLSAIAGDIRHLLPHD